MTTGRDMHGLLQLSFVVNQSKFYETELRLPKSDHWSHKKLPQITSSIFLYIYSGEKKKPIGTEAENFYQSCL